MTRTIHSFPIFARSHHEDMNKSLFMVQTLSPYDKIHSLYVTPGSNGLKPRDTGEMVVRESTKRENFISSNIWNERYRRRSKNLG